MATELRPFHQSRLAGEVIKRGEKEGRREKKRLAAAAKREQKNTTVLTAQNKPVRKTFKVPAGQELEISLGNDRTATLTPRAYWGISEPTITIEQNVPGSSTPLRRSVESSAGTYVIGGTAKDLSDSVEVFTSQSQPVAPQAMVKVKPYSYSWGGSQKFTVEALAGQSVTVKRKDQPVLDIMNGIRETNVGIYPFVIGLDIISGYISYRATNKRKKLG